MNSLSPNSKRLDDFKHLRYKRLPCVTCNCETYFIDQVCSSCRVQVPDHIPIEQVKRYILRIKKGNYYNAQRISKTI